MKRLVSAFLPVLFVFYAMGQTGNEWIAYNQAYLKIPVADDGIYRLTHEAIRQTGFPLSGDPRNFQLFHRGVEQSITVSGENDGVFDAVDYIEFYGRRNDGTLDSSLYEEPAHQPHKYYNLFSDTSVYFLTYGPVNGRRVVTHHESPSGLIEEVYHRAERLLILRNSYSGGVDYGSVQKTVFDAGEGWMGNQVVHGQELVYTLDGIVETSVTSGKPSLEVLLTGRGPMSHEVQLFAGTRQLSTISFTGYESHRHVQEIEWSDVDASGNLAVKLRVTGSGGPDRVSAGYMRLVFPQQVTMTAVAQRTFFLNATASGKSYLKIQNPPVGVRVFDVTDPSAVLHISGVVNSSLNVVVPSTSQSRKIFATSSVLTPAGLKRVVFRNINPVLHNYVIITHKSLRKPAAGYLDPVKAYAEYRSLPEGGGFDTLVVNVDQLYDQFNYGESSPRAIFQFMKFCASTKLPEYLFLIGKGLDVNYGYHRLASSFTLYKDLVPTAGYPASDMAFTAGLSSGHAPAVGTGRLSANVPADVAAYLNKVKERDALAFDHVNRKKILHLSGGIEESEPVLFREILRGYERIAEDLYLGGQVQAISKQSTGVKLINIAEQVNGGLGLITFFGHSAPNTLDFDIGLVTDPVMGYNNKGKYPFMLMNGCDAGSFFLNTAIMGENWIQTPDRGAVGFIAHSSYGLLSGLQRYSSTFYEVAFGDSAFIRKGVGRVQQEVSKRYIDRFGTSPQAISQIQQMVLLGDPAVRIFGADKPDYAPDEAGISISSFDDEPISALSDSFQIHLPVRNFGLARSEKIRIQVTRAFDGERQTTYDTIVSSVLFADTISILIRNTGHHGYGVNVFTVQVDADNLVDELNEHNNTATIEYFVPLNSVRNLFPYNYSIVNDRDIHLSFQYTDALAGTRDYLLEIDTTNTFDSGFKQQITVTAQVLGRHPVTLLASDSLVYYWRTRIAQPQETESDAWTTSSFTYIHNGPEGWAQFDFPQYEGNQTSGLVKDPALRRLHFRETVSDIAIKTFSASAGKPQDSVSFRINGVEFNLLYEGGACRNNTINLIAFDRRSTEPYAGIYFKWYEILYDYGGRRLLCGREPYVINSFTPNELVTGQQDDLLQYIDNIAVGDSVVLFNIGDAGFGQWPEAAKQKLGELGIATAQLQNLQNGDALVIFGRKGLSPGTAEIFHAPSPSDVVAIKKTIAGRYTSGTMGSGLIGPARRWDGFVSRVKDVETVDAFRFTVVGIAADGEQDTLKTGIQSNEDLSFIDAKRYPQLKVLFESEDDVNLTSVQLANWLVLYEPVAEGLAFYKGQSLQQVVLEGETVSRDFGFINVSNKMFNDSLLVRFDLVNPDVATTPSEIKIAAPAPGDTTLFTLPFTTVAKGGFNDVEVFVNPRITPEKTFDNNVIVLNQHLNVLIDHSRPVMEVTFDGRYIYNDEHVSANPTIGIRLWDENPFMLKTDTLGTRIFLGYPCETGECPLAPVYFSRDDVVWKAATDTSDFQIFFMPNNLAAGRYLLRVEAADASANTSDDEPYEIYFRVEHEETLMVSRAYPNPFALETRLEVIITGEGQMPRSYNFVIMTMDGRIVAGESADSATGLHVGKNFIRWDGMGTNGERLPGGIYFYRLLIAADGKEHEFNGKVVLLR